MNDADEEAAILERLKTWAADKPLRMNPDEDIASSIVKALLARKRKTGEAYCPCRRVTGDPEADRKIACPCVYVLDEVAVGGHCHCRLFVALE